jgi:hypothetical protein
MGELAWLGSRLTAAELQAITAADARGGIAAVRQLLAGSGLTDAGFAALDAQYGRGGLQAVGAAVQAQIQYEAQIEADQEAATALEGLRPEQWQAAAQVLSTGGPDALYREAVALGMSQAAAARAVEYVATSGVDQARQAVATQVQERARAEEAYTAAQRDFEAAQKEADPRDPLASQAVHQAALNYYATHAASIEAVGLGAKPGESPVQWVRRMANAGEETAAKVAQATGTAPETITRLFSDTRSREAEREMVSRIRESDAAQRKANAIKPQYPEGQKYRQPNEDQKIRDALERASKAMGLTDEPRRYGANDRLEMQLAVADEYVNGREPGSTFYPAGSHGRKAAAKFHGDVQRRMNPEPKPGIDGAMERASAYLEGRAVPERAPATSTPEESSSGMSLDDAIRAADHHLNGGNTDDE